MVAALTAAALSWLWCKILPVVGPPLGYVDEPGRDALKTHEVRAIPLAGPGLLIAVLVPMLWIGGMDPTILAGLVILTLLGAIDDRVGLSPGVRLGVEVSAAAVLCAELWNDSVGYFLFSVVVVVVAVNAVNLYDGIDGLAGSSGLVSLIGLAAYASLGGQSPWVPLLLAAAVVGFLPFNWHPGRVFLGDGGAYLVGAAIALGVTVSRAGDGVLTRLAALGFLGMFLVDLVITVGRRFQQGSRLFEGDRGHVYDRLVHSGMRVPAVTLLLTGAHAIIVGATLLSLWLLPETAALLVVLGVGVVALAMTWRVASRPPATD
ncbi:MAG TPA: MraY family glycosyltransferase [Acidimicrobiia bacterium]|nr:MraY family glycosyltransferase [Acidimicrobiia bacterium]